MQTVRPKKFLGQHFLTDQPTAMRIADTVDACPGLPILEVGGGMGVLTQYLLKKGRELKVVEIDRESIPYLHERFPALAGSIIEADFLKTDLHLLFDGRPFVLTGNYPYNISSQIFFKMLASRDLVPCCTGMIQREVAERLAASPGSKVYGVLSVLVQAWYGVELLFKVPPTVFAPPPKVESAVVRLTRNNRKSLGCEEQHFRSLVKTVFTMRRKMLRNSLRPLLPSGNSHPLLSDPVSTLRPEQLSVEDYIELTRRVFPQ